MNCIKAYFVICLVGATVCVVADISTAEDSDCAWYWVEFGETTCEWVDGV